MTDKYIRPNHLEVSSHFLHDAADFEIRYKHCINSDGPSFYTPRSRRLKTFIDLRMGIESILKALVAYHEHNDRKGKTIINWIEKFGHNIDKLLNKVQPHIPEDIFNEYYDHFKELTSLPVGLRYRIDAWDFHGNQEELYYRTIGSDDWLNHIHKGLLKLIELANNDLAKHSRILSGEELRKEVFAERYEKYT